MAQLTNLTDRISQLRDRKQSSAVLGGQRKSSPPPEPPRAKRRTPKESNGPRERKLAPDTFMVFAYTLLGIAMCCQLILLAWLDLL
ncbi:MAG: hypothetical protein ACOCVJ_03990 [Verrucomicrobiota bacterium]